MIIPGIRIFRTSQIDKKGRSPILMQMNTNMMRRTPTRMGGSSYSPDKLFPSQGQRYQNAAAPSNNGSGNGQSQNSSSNKHNIMVQFNPIRLQSETLELVQQISLDFDAMSPVEVRNQLRGLINAETEARNRREAYLNEVLSQKVAEIDGRYTEQFEKLRSTFESETEKFEKALKDRAQGVIKTIQIKHLDRLIDLVGRIRQIHNLHGGTNSSMPHQADLHKEPCQQTQRDLSNVIAFVDGVMAEQSSDDALSNMLLEQFNFSSQDEHMMHIQGLATTFNPSMRDQILALQQKSSNGIVANNNLLQNNHQSVLAGLQSAGGGSQTGGACGAATSYGNVTSGDGLPMSSGTNILSPNTTPSQDFANAAEATLSNPQIQNMHRSQTTANQFVKPGTSGRPRFVYDLPQDFPFNEAFIDKSLSNDLANSLLKSGSNGNGSRHSQQTASNHDVNPEDVLRTFTNSLHSGGTLGAIHSSLTYYKEALASKEWSNLSPSNAYQNFMWKKNLVGEIQKLAKEISRIPTEEAKILADLSKSHLSHEGSRMLAMRHGMINPQSQNALTRQFQQPPPGMSNAEAIQKGLGFIGNHESSIMMDLNRASIQAAQLDAEELKQKARRIVDDSATRLEPVVQSYTDAPLSQQLMQSSNLQRTAHGQSQPQPQNFIQYLQQPSSSIPDSPGLFPDRQNSSLQNVHIMYDNQQLPHNDSLMHDSCVQFEDLQNNSQQSIQQALPNLNYHASNERSQLSEATMDKNKHDDDEDVQHLPVKKQFQSNSSQRAKHGSIARQISKGHKRHGSLVVGQHTIMNQVEPNNSLGAVNEIPTKQEAGRKNKNKVELARQARRSQEHERDELSPKQMRKSSVVGADRKVFSNDAANTFTDMELEQMENAQNFQQTISFAQNDRIPHWLEDAREIAQNKVLFQQTAGPTAQARNMLASKLRSSRRRGTQSVASSHMTANQPPCVVSDQATGGFDARFGEQNLSNTVLDNKGRAIVMNQNQEQTSGNLYDELSRVAEYQSSRSVLDGYSNNKPRNVQSNLNRTMQVKKNQQTQQNARESEVARSGQYSREVISKSVLTNADRASPIISASGVTNGSQIAKMNIKKNQIKLVKGIATKRSSIQVAGSTSTGTGGQAQSKSVSRDGRIKVKLVANKNAAAKTPGLDPSTRQLDSVVQLSQCKNDSRASSLEIQQRQSSNQSSAKGGRNERKLVMATGGPSKSNQPQVIPASVLENQRQRDFSPQHVNQQRLSGLQQATQRTTLAKKIPFKKQQESAATRREDAASASNQRIRNNFFTEPVAGSQQQSIDSAVAAHQQNHQPTSQPVQPLKIRRNRKQAKRATPTIEESEEQLQTVQQQIDPDKQEAEAHFNEITRNLRGTSQPANIFIRKGSQYQTTAMQQQQQQHQQPQQPLTTNESESADAYKAGSVNQSRDQQSYGQDGSVSGTGKSRQPFVRTFKSHKSRQVEDLDRPFGTERVSFHKSALVANGTDNSKTNMTHGEDASNGKMQVGYKRPINSVNRENAVTVRVQSHSQPPAHPVEEPQIIPPPTQMQINENVLDMSQHRSSSAQMTGAGSINVTAKRPVVKMTAINFIGPVSSSDQPTKHQQKIQVSNLAMNNKDSGTNQFSFHKPQQQTQQPSQPQQTEKSSSQGGGKKQSVSALLDASPYMTQQQQQKKDSSKRIIHLKRPSTNLQISHSNQPSLVGKNPFVQRAASRVEQIDRQNDLSFQNANSGAASGSSMGTAGVIRPSAQIRISKKPTSTNSGAAHHKMNNNYV